MIQDAKLPIMMINIAYCEDCAKIIDLFEQKLSKMLRGVKE